MLLLEILLLTLVVSVFMSPLGTPKQVKKPFFKPAHIPTSCIISCKPTKYDSIKQIWSIEFLFHSFFITYPPYIIIYIYIYIYIYINYSLAAGVSFDLLQHKYKLEHPTVLCRRVKSKYLISKSVDRVILLAIAPKSFALSLLSLHLFPFIHSFNK